jgi:CheY-like chemotaxis protein
MGDSGLTSAAPASVLIVDDDPVARALLRAVFEGLSVPCRVYEAADSQSALRIAQTAAPRLVLLDIVLPGSLASGVAICQQLCKDFRTKVVIITGSPSRTIVDACLSAGALECIKKPFDTVEMRDKAEQWLR